VTRDPDFKRRARLSAIAGLYCCMQRRESVCLSVTGARVMASCGLSIAWWIVANVVIRHLKRGALSCLWLVALATMDLLFVMSTEPNTIIPVGTRPRPMVCPLN